MGVMKNFSLSEEELIRGFIFTNPHGKDSFIYPTPLLTGEEFLPFISAYSRTDLPMQDRVLEFLNTDKTDQVKALLPLIKELVTIFRKPDGSLKIHRKTAEFNKKWAIMMMHNSIKEHAYFTGYSEDISDMSDKYICGHPLASPMVKSTRYVFFDNQMELFLGDPDIKSLKSEKYIKFIEKLFRRNAEVADQLTEYVANHKYTKEFIEFQKSPVEVEKELKKWMAKQDKSWLNDYWINIQRGKILTSRCLPWQKKEIKKFVLDYARMYLPSSVKTSLGYSMNARTLAEVIKGMLSSPRKEEQERGQSIWNEAKKIAPVLMGEGAISINRDEIKREEQFREWVEHKFPFGAKKQANMVNLIKSTQIDQESDKFIASLLLYPYCEVPLEVIYKALNAKDVKEVIAKSHEFKNNVSENANQSGLLTEVVMPWHAYRDIYRHRKGGRLRQLLTTRLGYEIPEIFKLAGISEEFKKDMEEAKQIYEQARLISPYIAEKLVPFAFKHRSLQSWSLNQIAYIVSLRSRAKTAHRTYMDFARELGKKTAEIYPETCKHLDVGNKKYPCELWKTAYRWWDSQHD